MTASSSATNDINPSQPWATTAAALADGAMPPGWTLVNSSGYARVAYHAGDQIYFKLFLPRSPLESIKAREYLFSTAVPGQGIDRWLRHELPAGSRDDLPGRRALLRELGVFIGRLHHSGFIHGDLRTGNVLAEWRGGRFRFALIDNERNSRHDMPPGKLLLKNLMQLNMHTPSELSRSDRWRFFESWRRQMRELSDTDARLVAVESYRWAMRRLAAKGKLEGGPAGAAQ